MVCDEHGEAVDEIDFTPYSMVLNEEQAEDHLGNKRNAMNE